MFPLDLQMRSRVMWCLCSPRCPALKSQRIIQKSVEKHWPRRI